MEITASPPQDESVNRLRKEARDAFIRGTNDGSLQTAFFGLGMSPGVNLVDHPSGI